MGQNEDGLCASNSFDCIKVWNPYNPRVLLTNYQHSPLIPDVLNAYNIYRKAAFCTASVSGLNYQIGLNLGGSYSNSGIKIGIKELDFSRSINQGLAQYSNNIILKGRDVNLLSSGKFKFFNYAAYDVATPSNSNNVVNYIRDTRRNLVDLVNECMTSTKVSSVIPSQGNLFTVNDLGDGVKQSLPDTGDLSDLILVSPADISMGQNEDGLCASNSFDCIKVWNPYNPRVLLTNYQHSPLIPDVLNKASSFSLSNIAHAKRVDSGNKGGMSTTTQLKVAAGVAVASGVLNVLGDGVINTFAALAFFGLVTALMALLTSQILIVVTSMGILVYYTVAVYWFLLKADAIKAIAKLITGGLAITMLLVVGAIIAWLSGMVFSWMV